MATGESSLDGIEFAEASMNTVNREDNKPLKLEEFADDGREKSGIPPPLDMSAAASLQNASGPKTPTGIARHKSERERKIGHRRVGVGGEITYKKIQTSQIMGSIQLGIQHAVGGLASKPERDLLMQDFMTVETTNFPSDGSSHTPAHHYSEFRFRTYAPIAFRYFRDLFGIQPDDFLISMCSAPMRELSNPGASGSIFYLTEDDEFIVKTVQHKEGEFLQKLLPGYYMNLNQNPRTLLPKFFGLYCYQCNSKNVRLAVMNNLLPSTVRLHQKYDLKGSTYKRKASKTERQKSSPTFKDLDFIDHHPEGIGLEADTFTALVKTIQRDCRVLESFKIMDYSLLVGIHNLDQAARDKAERRSANARALEEGCAGDAEQGPSAHIGDYDREHSVRPGGSTALNRSRSINRQRLVAHSTAMESIQAESEPIDEEEDVPPGGIPARNSRGERLLLFIGIIDILQSYRLKKKLEHTWKAMIHDGDTVSVHRPAFYAQRFQDFMSKTVFRKIPSLDLPEIKGNHRKFRTLVTSYIALKHSPSKRKSISRPMRSTDIDAEIGAASPPSNAAASAAAAAVPSSAPISIPSALAPVLAAGAGPSGAAAAATGAGTAAPALPASAGALSPPLGAVGPGGAAPPFVGPVPPPPQPSPPSYPAVLKDRPPSFSKGHIAATAGAPGSAKIPPPVPPRGSSPHSRRGSVRFGQQPTLRRSLRSPPPTVGVCSSSSSNSSSNNGGGGGRRPLGPTPRSVTFTLESPPPTYEYLASTESSFTVCASLTESSSSATLAESKVIHMKSLGSSTSSSHMIEPDMVATFLSKKYFSASASKETIHLGDATEDSSTTNKMEGNFEKTLGCIAQSDTLSVSNLPLHPEAPEIQSSLPPELALRLPKPFASRSPVLSSVFPPVYTSSSVHSEENVNSYMGDSKYLEQDSLVLSNNTTSATSDCNISIKPRPCTSEQFGPEDLV